MAMNIYCIDQAGYPNQKMMSSSHSPISATLKVILPLDDGINHF